MDSEINPKDVAIAAGTCYPKWYLGQLRSLKHTDKIRGDLALNLFKTSLNLRYQVVVIDTVSSRSFRRELLNFKGFTIIRKNKPMKRSPARRLAFKVASKLKGVKVIIYTDPEKISFVANSIPDVIKPILDDKADIVIPKRNLELFKSTYPAYQFESESEGNKLYNEQLRMSGLLVDQDQDLDIFFGPRVFKNDPKILRFFMKKFGFHTKDKNLFSILQYDVEDFSNAIFFPVVMALKKKLRVQSVEILFSYPKLQKENEEFESAELFIEKRKAQKMSALIELMHLINFLEKI